MINKCTNTGYIHVPTCTCKMGRQRASGGLKESQRQQVRIHACRFHFGHFQPSIDGNHDCIVSYFIIWILLITCRFREHRSYIRGTALFRSSIWIAMCFHSYKNCVPWGILSACSMLMQEWSGADWQAWICFSSTSAVRLIKSPKSSHLYKITNLPDGHNCYLLHLLFTGRVSLYEHDQPNCECDGDQAPGPTKLE
jgi:hypothetical protein